MDYQNRIGSKKGGGGVASSQELSVAQRQRVSQLFDVESSPYLHKNHLGQFECKLCLTLHNTKESFLNHSQGRKHVLNLKKRETLQRRQDEEEKRRSNQNNSFKQTTNGNLIAQYVKIGLPSFKIKKLRNENGDFGLFIVVNYPKSNASIPPIFRFMSSFEVNSMKPESNISKNDKQTPVQFFTDIAKKEDEKKEDRDGQYLIVHSKPYDNISFKLPTQEILKDENFWDHWDSDMKELYIQFYFKSKAQVEL